MTQRTRTSLVGLAALMLGTATALAACTQSPSEARTTMGETQPSNGAGTPGEGLSFRPVDGSGQPIFGDSLITDQHAYFPIAVWNASVLDEGQLEEDRAMGINTYVEMTPDSDLKLVRKAGIPAISSSVSEDAAGFVLPDEVDMWARAGDAAWSGNSPGEGDICIPSSAACGFTVLREVIAGVPTNQMLYANFGKGVTFWENDENASRFVNNYADVVSADNYWFTDPNICNSHEGGKLLPGPEELTTADCRLAANYGRTVERLRSLVVPAGSIPVWAFVEIGHPFSEADSPTITIGQIRGAVWSSLVHGARGIVYFNHSFGGDCASQNVLRDCGEELRKGMAKINREVARAAPVLNAPFLDNAIKSEGPVDASAKAYGEDVYIIAAPARSGKHSFRIALPCSTQDIAEVVGEGRSVELLDGILQDEFAEGDAFRMYRINGTGCIPDS